MNIDNSMGEVCVGEAKYENRLNRPYFLSSSKNVVVKTMFYYIIY